MGPRWIIEISWKSASRQLAGKDRAEVYRLAGIPRLWPTFSWNTHPRLGVAGIPLTGQNLLKSCQLVAKHQPPDLAFYRHFVLCFDGQMRLASYKQPLNNHALLHTLINPKLTLFTDKALQVTRSNFLLVQILLPRTTS